MTRLEKPDATLCLVRHGQVGPAGPFRWSVAAANRYLAGRPESGLSSRGTWQAQRVAERLQAEEIDAVYCSPSARARESAYPLAAKLGLEARSRAELVELNPGSIPERGLTPLVLALADTLRKRTVERWAPAAVRSRVRSAGQSTILTLYLARWLLGSTDGGEPVREALSRVRSALEGIAHDLPAGGTAAVFTHGYFILLATALCVWSWPLAAHRTLLRPLTIPHASLTRLSRGSEGRWTLELCADQSHLRGARDALSGR